MDVQRDVQRVTTILGVSALLLAMETSAGPLGSNYYVRPGLRVNYPAEFQDGIEVNGATTKTQVQGAIGNSRSRVSLDEGTVKMYIDSQGNNINLQTFGGFGERVTVTGGAGTNWSFSFAVDGYLETQGGAPRIEGVPDPLWFYDIGLAIYEPGVATYNTFNSVELRTSSANLFYGYDSELRGINSDLEFEIQDAFLSIDGFIPLASNFEVFDIFVFTNIIVDPEIGDGLENYIADFENTASYSQEFAPGVEAFSSSGRFLGLTTAPQEPPGTPVSLPAPAMLMGIGLCLLRLRRKA